MVTSQSSTREDSTDSDIYLASYRNYTIRPDYSNEIKVSLCICWPHCEDLHEMRCQHDNPYCKHTPLRWINKYTGKGCWGRKPIFYNSPPEPYLWYEQEQWLE
jgi:hypothetical protein